MFGVRLAQNRALDLLALTGPPAESQTLPIILLLLLNVFCTVHPNHYKACIMNKQDSSTKFWAPKSSLCGSPFPFDAAISCNYHIIKPITALLHMNLRRLLEKSLINYLYHTYKVRKSVMTAIIQFFR